MEIKIKTIYEDGTHKPRYIYYKVVDEIPTLGDMIRVDGEWKKVTRIDEILELNDEPCWDKPYYKYYDVLVKGENDEILHYAVEIKIEFDDEEAEI